MNPVHAVQDLPLAAMFVATLGFWLVLCWAILALVRIGVRLAGLEARAALPLRDTLIATLSAIFALLLAFSAAGIWNDSVQARSAVQREANALENVLALSTGLPPELQGQIRDDVRRYARLVIESDWAAMARNTDINDPVYDRSDGILVGLIDRLALEQARARATPGVGPLLMQLVEARTARLARITLSDAGVTMAQWLGMLLIACAALAAIALCHNHHFGMQALAMTLYAIAASSAFFVVLAHDRPFVGGISVSSAPLHHLAPR